MLNENGVVKRVSRYGESYFKNPEQVQVAIQEVL